MLEMSLPEEGLHIHSKWTKRTFDILLSTIIFLLFSPLFLLGCLLSKIQSRGPIFYKANRVGQNGLVFKMYKFRTMVVNADQIGIGLTTHNDVRVTPIGRIMRFIKLDELPNFLNVIKGDMSLTGPRPESPTYVEHYTDEQRQVLLVRPGITGPSQIANRNEEIKLAEQTDPEYYYITELMPKKLSLDLYYVATQSFFSDIKWLLITLWVIVFPQKVENQTIIHNRPTNN